MLFIFVMPFLVNIIVGAAFAIGASIFYANVAYMAGTLDYEAIRTIVTILHLVAVYNISFALFSLIPIYPLNGTHLLWALKPIWAVKLTQYEAMLKILLVFFIGMAFARQVFEPMTLRVIWALSVF